MTWTMGTLISHLLPIGTERTDLLWPWIARTIFLSSLSSYRNFNFWCVRSSSRKVRICSLVRFRQYLLFHKYPLSNWSNVTQPVSGLTIAGWCLRGWHIPLEIRYLALLVQSSHCDLLLLTSYGFHPYPGSLKNRPLLSGGAGCQSNLAAWHVALS